MQEAAASTLTAAEFFSRVRQRLTLEGPPGLTDPSVTPARGDHDADPVMRKIAEVRPIRPAAVLVPVVDQPEPTVLLTQLYMTTLGYRIVPMIARVKPGFTLKLNTSEVDNTFEVPLAFLMDQANVQRHSRDWQGMTRHYYAITFGEHYIWGVTAGILRNLYDRIYR